MVLKRELSSKLKKKFLGNILAPGLPKSRIKQLIYFETIIDKQTEYLLDKDKKIAFFNYKGIFLPSLTLIRQFNEEILFPSVSVDDGAVPHLLNGADIFAAGITTFDEFKQNDYLCIRNPKGHVLCLGSALIDSKDLKKESGKVILNIHHLGDHIWKENTS